MTRVRLMARAVTAKLARIARRLNARASAPPKATIVYGLLVDKGAPR